MVSAYVEQIWGVTTVNQGDIIKQKTAGSILSSRINIAVKFVKYYT